MRERLVFEDSLVGSQHIVNSSGIPEQACHASLASTPDRLLLLGSQGHHITFIYCALMLDMRTETACCMGNAQYVEGSLQMHFPAHSASLTLSTWLPSMQLGLAQIIGGSSCDI